ncbi:MAG: DUF1003 domain-containing protein [Actinomycetota bacterium]|nr:DUF1003 domain-containing protein [Actinomycetota bacterium]
MRRPQDLSSPRGGIRVGIHYDPEAFGRFSEGIARFIGTARYLVLQTIVITLWIAWNVGLPGGLQFDEYPFILLTLALSMQASYAAPLILLAQNRQEARDREQARYDREQAARTQADTEFLARELASIRLALADVVTNEDLDRAVERLEVRGDGTRPPRPPDGQGAAP